MGNETLNRFSTQPDSNVLYVGLRTGGSARVGSINTAAVTPNAWHHLAASFRTSTRTLTIYLDGAQRAQSVFDASSAGNSLPLNVGRTGPGGEYWLGKLDDVRIWNVVRTVAEISANFQGELIGAPAGLVANWRLNDGFGTTAADSAGTAQNATLLGGAAWSTDVP